jgi:hypothetical protein
MELLIMLEKKKKKRIQYKYACMSDPFIELVKNPLLKVSITIDINYFLLFLLFYVFER